MRSGRGAGGSPPGSSRWRWPRAPSCCWDSSELSFRPLVAEELVEIAPGAGGPRIAGGLVAVAAVEEYLEAPRHGPFKRFHRCAAEPLEGKDLRDAEPCRQTIVFQ